MAGTIGRSASTTSIFRVSENFFFAITDPRFNHPGSRDFNPNLATFDLTRGGHWFRFSDKGAGHLQTVFLQDRIKLGRFQLNLGGRFDRYRFLTVGSQFQPRLGVAYHLKETGTVLRASYNRNYQTPPNENLLLSNSEAAGRLAPPDVRRDLNGGVILIGSQRQNVYEVGLQQRLADRASLNAVFFHKDSPRSAGQRQLPQYRNHLPPPRWPAPTSTVSRPRLTLPEIHRFGGSVSTTHYHVVVTPPFTGGLFLGSAALDLLSEGPFVIDHDQKLAVSGLLTYRPRQNWWTSWQVRYDSGLVPNPSDPAQVARDPDYFDQLAPGQPDVGPASGQGQDHPGCDRRLPAHSWRPPGLGPGFPGGQPDRSHGSLQLPIRLCRDPRGTAPHLERQGPLVLVTPIRQRRGRC